MLKFHTGSIIKGFAIFALFTSSMLASIVNLSTGTATYTITSDTNGAHDGTTVYTVTTPDASWVPNPITNGVSGINGVWIAPNANQSVGPATTGANGVTVYQSSFSLAGLNASTAVLTMNLTGDDFVAGVTLNGTTIFTPTSSEVSNGMWTGTSGVFTVNDAGSIFNSGLNTLVYTVDNYQGDGYTGPSYGYGGPTGLNVAASISANPLVATPEPASVALLGIACLFVVARQRRLVRR